MYVGGSVVVDVASVLRVYGIFHWCGSHSYVTMTTLEPSKRCLRMLSECAILCHVDDCGSESNEMMGVSIGCVRTQRMCYSCIVTCRRA